MTRSDDPNAAGGPGAALAPLAPAPRPPRIPLSSAQARLWFLYRLDGPNPTYNVPLVWRITGPLDASALAGAMADVRERHESLRTVIGEEDGRPFQRVLDPAGLAPCLTVEQVAEPDLAAAVGEICRYCFDLTAEAPFQGRLLRADPTSTTALLVVLVHHIAVDGWSLGPLLRDLGEAYAARLAGARAAWSPLPVQYADYCLWQSELLAGRDGTMHPRMQADLDFWTAALAGSPADATVPADHPCDTDGDRPSATVAFEIGAEVRRDLAAVARACRTSLFVTLHAAVAILLRDAGAGTDVPLGVPIAGRDADGLDDVVGMFVNTVVLRADVSGAPTFRDVVTQLARRDLDALAHGGIPFDQVMNALTQRREPGRGIGFQIMLGLEQDMPGGLTLTGAHCVAEPAETDTAKCDLDFVFVAPPGKPGSVGLSGLIQYDSSLFEAATVEDLAARLVRLLGDAAARPDARAGRSKDTQTTGRSSPRTQTADLLTELFADCLGACDIEIGIDDDFFSLAGDKLAVARLVNRIRSSMDVEFSVDDLKRMPTVAMIAMWLDELDEAA